MCRICMTTHRLDKNVSGKCSAKPHMSQGCWLSRSDSPQLVNSMRRRQWRRTHKHTFPVYVIGLMTWFAKQQSVYFLPICMLFIYLLSEISIADISTLFISIMDISTSHISIMDTSRFYISDIYNFNWIYPSWMYPWIVCTQCIFRILNISRS